MPTKKIQLRGISRTPSDRMSADGGLAESIGFETDMQELAVNVPATDVTTELGLNNEVQGAEVVYIHKTNDYTNYIAKSSIGVGWLKTDELELFYQFETGETFKEIKSVGNTLVLLTANEQGKTKRMEYVLFKDGEYNDLGDELPEPRIKVEAVLEPDSVDNPNIEHGQFDFIIPVATEQDFLNYRELANTAQTDNHWARRKDQKLLAYSLYDAAVEAVKSDESFNNKYGYYNYPLFVRYAIRLYDGKYIRHSVPIMVDGSNFESIEELAFCVKVYEDNGYKVELRRRQNSGWVTFGQLLHPYHLEFTVDDSNRAQFQKWSDIVKGVDIFITPEINPISDEIGVVTPKSNQSADWTRECVMHAHVLDDNEMRERILSDSSLFYKIKAIDIDDYNSSTGVIFSTAEEQGIGGDSLVVRDKMSDDNHTNDGFVPTKLSTYNSRLYLVGSDITLYGGGYNLPSEKNAETEHYIVSIIYYIRNNNGALNKVIRTYNEVKALGPWLYYPDARCFKAEIYHTNHSATYDRYAVCKRTVVMDEHTMLNGAYAYIFDFYDENNVEWYISNEYAFHIYHSTAEFNAAMQTILQAAPYEHHGNTLYLSDGDNPFLYPIQQTFAGNITDIAFVTKALSTGQFGYSSLYIFSDNGLWTLQTNADGSFGKPDAISQDVALPGTVCQLDQAVVFTTKKGVMLLTGSDLRCISDRMHGRHYKLDTSIYTLLTTFFATEWGELAEMAHEDMPFMEYMAGARTAYDYVGRRLLFFKETNPLPYIYAYMIETDSWHKVIMPAGFEFKSVLNSYPDTYIAMDRKEDVTEDEMGTENRYAAVMCFSNARSQDDDTRYKGMIVTRPIDLDEDDVRKVLNRLFVRGIYPKEAQVDGADIGSPVKMLLLGSEDGLTWQKLRSFRGGSYKLFRLVLLCQLTQAERISYVEAEFETRYTGRLR